MPSWNTVYCLYVKPGDFKIWRQFEKADNFAHQGKHNKNQKYLKTERMVWKNGLIIDILIDAYFAVCLLYAKA